MLYTEVYLNTMFVVMWIFLNYPHVNFFLGLFEYRYGEKIFPLKMPHIIIVHVKKTGSVKIFVIYENSCVDILI